MSGQGNCREGAVRLVNSTTEYEGRVEVCLDGVWGTVCGVGYSDATVICRTVGFDGGINLLYIILYTLNLLQRWSTTVLTICLEMVDVQFIIIFDAVDVNQTLERVEKVVHIRTTIAV